MQTPRLHWTRGRRGEAAGEARALEWIGCDDAGSPVARVIRLQGPVRSGWRTWQAVALDTDARVVELRPDPPGGGVWLACIGGKVVGRAAVPLAAVRTVEAVLAV